MRRWARWRHSADGEAITGVSGDRSHGSRRAFAIIVFGDDQLRDAIRQVNQG
jgi:hypothetical protein